jgi:hypothetical protein
MDTIYKITYTLLNVNFIAGGDGILLKGKLIIGKVK